MAQHRLGFEVAPGPFPMENLAQLSEDALFVNCNNQHWTVLRQMSGEGPWEHVNSVVGQGRLWQGLKNLETRGALFDLFAGLQDQYGSFTLHRVTRSRHDDDGARFLET